jgi:oligopeptide transport system substrate-binding protein
MKNPVTTSQVRGGARTFVLVLALLLGACTKKLSTAEYGLDSAETLRINMITEPPSLDWSKSTDTTSALVMYNIMDGLTRIDTEDAQLKVVPALAESWSTKDARVWIFKLRKDVKWTDGRAFTAQQVLDGWERILNPETASEYAYQLYGIKNARAYNEGELKDFREVGVKITDAGELKVELERPKAYFPYLLSHHSMYPLRKDVVEKFGNAWTEPEHLVSLGPYRLKVWDHDKALVLIRNEAYYGEPAKTKNILVYIIPETSTAMNLYNAGRIDALNDLPSSELSQLRKRPDYQERGVIGTYYYGFNTSKPPFDNPRVRRAVSMAIDRKQLTDLLAGGQIPLYGWIPNGMMGYDPEVGLRFDAAKARKLLEEAGYKDRSKLPMITIGYSTSDDNKRIAENVQAQLKTNLGLNIQLSNEEWKTYLQTLKANPPAIFRLGWLADYPDPDNFMSLITSYSENNHTHWGSKRYDELVERAVSLTDPAERAVLYKEGQKILTETEVPVMPLFTMVTQQLVAPRVENYPLNAMKEYRYDKVVLKGKGR